MRYYCIFYVIFSVIIKLFYFSCVIESKISIINNNEKASIYYPILTE